MFALAMRSVRQRPGRFVATLIAALLGAVITMMFSSLLDTGGAAGVDSKSAEVLNTSGGVVGGYSSLLVFFAVASTLTVNVRQRDDEIKLLRSTGATPAQIKRMVVGEAAMIAVVAVVLAVGPAMLAGRALLKMFQDSDQVVDSVDYVFGPMALTSGIAITLVASMGAAFLAVRRATKAMAGGSGTEGKRRGNRLRNVGGALALLVGAGALATTFAMNATDSALMAAPAAGAIMLSVGFACFAPALLRALLGVFGGPIAAVGGASGYLTVHNMRQRAEQLSGMLMPLISFTGVATATFYMQLVENDAIKASGLTKSIDDKNLETLNLVVVGVIAAFCCIMLVNSLYAATTYRSKEFGGQRLAGATPGQVLRMVGMEGVVLTVTGVFFGTLAGLAGILPFTIVRTDSVLPDQGLGVWLGVVAVAAVATLLTSLLTAVRTLRTPAITAVGLAA
ncbi:transporter [Streptomyces sp. AcH 505]|uniref:FtsX-like permease family protein n=1 Tax=Streptomyces sp. AcH 505 TaxID=352211 RepID=UPI000591D8A1|nr:transporter [Streptomyces sp. AcH 505]